MRLYNLGKVPWQESQLIYHALAEMGWEALSLVSPSTPYVCIGFHQDVEQEVDLAYCNANNNTDEYTNGDSNGNSNGDTDRNPNRYANGNAYTFGGDTSRILGLRR